MERWVSPEKRGIEGKWAPPVCQVNLDRWATLVCLERKDHLDCKEYQGLQGHGDPPALEAPKAEGVHQVLMAQWETKALQGLRALMVHQEKSASLERWESLVSRVKMGQRDFRVFRDPRDLLEPKDLLENLDQQGHQEGLDHWGRWG